MKKLIFICAAFILALPAGAFAGEFKDKGEIIAVDFPSGWVTGKTDDPAVTLKLEKGKSFFEFSRQDSELGDYYLKARVKEQVDSLRGKGNTLSGEIRSASLHGVSSAYYTSYDSMGAEAYMAFFTYNAVSYAVSARGLSDGDFRGVLSSVRKPGEKIEQPKPKKIRVVRQKKEKDDGEDLLAQIIKNGEVSTAAVAGATQSVLNAVEVSTETAVGASTRSASTAAGSAAQSFLSDLAQKEENALPPYLPRKPLPLALWAVLIGVWAAGAFAARAAAAAYKNPKLPPPPSDVPPDFFFPFVISRVSTFMDVTYNVLTRQRQLLLASFPYEHELYLAGSVYGCFFFHVAWSLLGAVGQGDAVVNALVKFPLLGRAFASLPEIFFILPFIAGLFIYFTKERELEIYDAQSALVMSARPETFYGLIRDGAGKEVARLVSKGTFLYRYWEFVDTDNVVVFSIRDDFPKGYLLRKLFGNLGGALRSRYGIFVQDRRAGFVFLDPYSAGRFQIHMDYAFARLSHPAQILAAVLYVISLENDPLYPSPF